MAWVPFAEDWGAAGAAVSPSARLTDRMVCAWAGVPHESLLPLEVTESNLEPLLVEVVGLAAQQLGPEAVTGTFAFDDKWLHASNMQKAIRRGLVDDAVASACSLERLDAEYLWRRLPTIALEDLCMGDPLLMAGLYSVCGKAKWRAGFGERRVLRWIVARMAQAPKDRSACDLMCWADADPAMKPHWKSMTWVDRAALAELMANSLAPTVVRMLASWRLAGMAKHEHSKMPGNAGDWGRWRETAVAMGLPPLLLFVAERAHKRQRDAMMAALPLIWELLASDPAAVVVRDYPTGEETRVGGYLSPSLDKHTQVGKRAMAYFAKACAPVREFLEKVPAAKDGLGLAIFMVESSLLTRQIRYAGRDAMERATRVGELAGRGLSESEGAELCALIEQNLDKLTKARLRVTA